MREKMKLKFLLMLILTDLLLVHKSLGFNECPVNPAPYPATPEIDNCLKLLAFLQTQGQNVGQWCNVPNNFKQCCHTCNNYNSCENIAYDGSCDEKARQNQCGQIMANFLPVSYFCPKSCGNCAKEIRCSNLPSGCNGGVCYSASYFSKPSVRCECPSGKGGSYCQEINACLQNPCQNGGQCVPHYEQQKRYTCFCRANFNGYNCEYTMNTCLSGNVNCQNGGTCMQNSDGSPYCKCSQGFGGLHCESYIGSCGPNQCMNGGSCIPSLTHPYYYCVCKADYAGLNCQTRLLCNTLTCQNNGVCHESPNGGTPTCQCKLGYEGKYCQNQIGGCTQNPCQNGGTCIAITSAGPQAYICICPSNNSGQNCQFFNNGCGNTLCQNGGTCFLGANQSPQCQCQNGFTGNLCEKFVGTCNSCLNGGTCIANQHNGINTCICPTGYTGNICEHKINCDRGDTNVNQCKNWSSYGFCNLKYTFNLIPIPVYCPISCNMCNNQCQDAANECPIWAVQGLCPSIVSQNNGLCRKSCAQCYYAGMNKKASETKDDAAKQIEVVIDNGKKDEVESTTTENTTVE